jgi:hypothetical protein
MCPKEFKTQLGLLAGEAESLLDWTSGVELPTLFGGWYLDLDGL